MSVGLLYVNEKNFEVCLVLDLEVRIIEEFLNSLTICEFVISLIVCESVISFTVCDLEVLDL